jgi:hypothetical protein
MEGKGPATPGAGLPELVATLEESIVFLSQDEALQSARERLATAINARDSKDVAEAAQAVLEKLEVITQLTKTLQTLDPHVLEEGQFAKLWEKRPKDLVEEAVVEGKFRERRIILQAKEAETNRLLVRTAIGASVVALAVPVVERLLSL